ncbi:hypothetical protein BH11CYA1_BH11CYA1_12600 [soil metagenome]
MLVSASALLDVEGRIPGLAARNSCADGTAAAAVTPRPGALAFLEFDGSLTCVDNLEDEFASAILRVAGVRSELTAAEQLEVVGERTFDVPLGPVVLVLGQDHVDLLTATEVLEGRALIFVTTSRVEDAGGAGDGRRGSGLQWRTAPLAFVQQVAAGVAQAEGEVRSDTTAFLATARDIQAALGGARLA